MDADNLALWGGVIPETVAVDKAKLAAARDIAAKLPCTSSKCQNAVSVIDISRRTICDRCTVLAYLNSFLQ